MDSKNNHKDDLLWYANFVSDNKGQIYIRERYNLLDIYEETGGMYSTLCLIVCFFVFPLVYRKNELKILKNARKLSKEYDNSIA